MEATGLLFITIENVKHDNPGPSPRYAYKKCTEEVDRMMYFTAPFFFYKKFVI